VKFQLLACEGGLPLARIGAVTTTLPFQCSDGDTFESWRVQSFRKAQSYELGKIHPRFLRGCMRLRSLDCDGADERAPFDAPNGNAWRFHATFDGTDANAQRSHAKLCIRLSPLQRQPFRSG
jgi:hypothetical protein